MESQMPLFEEFSTTVRESATPQESNRRFCKELETALIGLGFSLSPDESLQPNSFCTRQTYKDMYGADRQSSFLINSTKYGLVRVEAHRQEKSGSVDQKFPFFFQSMLGTPEKYLVIVFDGDGYKKEAYTWLTSKAESVEDKVFKVFRTLDHFLEWITNAERN
ncbi:PD-(D/E)XK nuclease superfamily protein [Pseudoalteromonas sp. PPB1]|uniref:PD-(D/E)XK nuclease superfamily protein n=1 Tax=Pseudoalteromonas sp. PPB1 TaxID=2756136 RepID=UPI0018919B8F|nr:PD-(D/E)XK nuclease superfamily protein [Pseudoalteromonas sp. PPB1]